MYSWPTVSRKGPAPVHSTDDEQAFILYLCRPTDPPGWMAPCFQWWVFGVRVRPKAAVGQTAYGIDSDFVLGMADGAFCDFFFRHDSAPRTLPFPAVVSGNAGGGALVTKNIGLSYVGRGGGGGSFILRAKLRSGLMR